MAAMTDASFVLAVAIVLRRGDRVLALRRAADKDVGAGIWETVSGRVAPDEVLEDAARREVREETGVAIEAIEGPIDAYVMRRGERPMCVVVYAADVGEQAIVRSSEHDADAWLTLAEAEAQMPARLAQAVRRALAK